MPSYLIVDIQVKDPAQYEIYKREVPRVIHKHGGRYIVRGGATEVIEGDWHPTRLVVLEFPDHAALRGFLDDPEYAPLIDIRHAAATSSTVAVEGF